MQNSTSSLGGERIAAAKAKLKHDRLTASSWARLHGYKPWQVIRVLSGTNKGYYGVAREIAEKLGILDA